jgi:hypothetical protein
MEPHRLLALCFVLQAASSMFYCENTSLVLLSFREVFLSGKRPDTLVLLKPRCKETSVPDRMDKRFYACANSNLLLDECRLSLPSRYPFLVATNLATSQVPGESRKIPTNV